MKPPFAYYGGKTRLAEWVVSLMPAHRVYVEPFAGSAAVLFAKPPSTHEILNDLNGDVVNFFRVLRERPVDLELACRLTPYAREEYEQSDPDEPGIDPVERARRWWSLSVQSFGGSVKVGTSWSSSIQKGSNNSRSAWNRIAHFAPAADRLGTVTIECRDALEVIERYSAEDGLIYCDPPYLMETRSGLDRRPSGDYVHEFKTQEDHERLAAALHASPAAVLLSGYPSPLYDALYPEWDKAERVMPKRITNGRGGRGETHAVEVVWSNRPLDSGRLFDISRDGRTG